MSNDTIPLKTIVFVVGVILAAILLYSIVTPVTIKGNQLGIKESVWTGISPIPMTPKTYIVPGMFETVYRYDMTPRVLSLGNQNTIDGKQLHDGADFKKHRAISSDNQAMEVSLKVQWSFDPANMIELHKKYKPSIDSENAGEAIIETKLLYQNVINAININATKFRAIDAYSGKGYIQLQEQIRRSLLEDKTISNFGILITNVTLDTIELDSKYIGEINTRQLAEMQTLRAQQEEIAAEAQAKVAKALAQADLNKQVVEAERKKQVDILESEAKKQQVINEATAKFESVKLAAQADAEKVTLNARAQADQVVMAAKAEQEAGSLKAAAILAIGQAEAESTKLKMLAYSSNGSQQFVTIEVAKAMADGYKGIQGFIPQGMSVNTLSTDWMGGLQSVLNRTMPAPAK